MVKSLIMTRASRRYHGWYSYYRGDSRLPFERVCNAAGFPILYKTKNDAEKQAAEHARIDARIYVKAETGR